MPTGELLYLCLIVAAFAAFGLTLAIQTARQSKD
jgi:hypothetical protein